MSLSAREAKRDAIPGRLTDFYIPLDEIKGLDQPHLHGYGRESTVYKCTYQGKTVAVKSLKIPGDQVYSELDALTTLALNPHKNITQFIGFSEEPGNHVYLILEWVDFILANILEESHSFLKTYLSVPENLIKFMLGMANGIAHLHRNNIIWRDIIGGNILIDKDMNPKLSDFGVSCLLKGNVSKWGRLVSLTRDAPETHANLTFTPASDVYCFGEIMLGTVGAMAQHEELMKWAGPIFKPCLAENPQDRPTIQKIAEQLAEKISVKLEPIVAKEQSVTPLSTCYIHANELKLPSNRGFNCRLKGEYKQHAVILDGLWRRGTTEQLQELDVLAVLNRYPHPNVVAFHGITEIDGVRFVMEDIDPLSHYTGLKDTLVAYLSDPVNFLTFTLGILKGIEHVQSLNILLKFITLNILGVGKQNEPKLLQMHGADFENSKLKFEHTHELTEAPEVMKNWSYTPTTSSWGMGIVVCDLHCHIKYKVKYTPYGDDEDPFDGIVKGTKTPKLPNDMIPGLADIVRPCFNFDPKRRPTIKELKEKTTLLMNSLFAAAQSQKQSEKNLPADKTKTPDHP